MCLKYSFSLLQKKLVLNVSIQNSSSFSRGTTKMTPLGDKNDEIVRFLLTHGFVAVYLAEYRLYND
jgi:hypothetical protein